MDLENRFTGSLLGLALADALGAPHEGGVVGGLLWAALGIGKGDLLRWTDDTQMAVVLCRSLAEHGGLEPASLAMAWAQACDPMRGYGGGARRLLKLIRGGMDWRQANQAIFPDGSFGNGAAMRAAPLGLFFHRDLDELRRATRIASSITHAHPIGIDGGLLIARGTALALLDERDPAAFLGALHGFVATDELRGRIELAQAWLGQEPAARQVARELGNGVLAQRSAVTAVHCFLRFPEEFEAMMAFVVKLGGDTDTIGAMAGGMWGARNGCDALPQGLLERLETRDEIEGAARGLWLAWQQVQAGR